MRILFYDKQVKYNCPNYAIPFLRKLSEQGHEIKILCGGKTKENVSEKISNKLMSDIYIDFDMIYFSLKTTKEIFENFKPEIFISDFIYSGIEERIMNSFKAYGSKIVLIDMVGSEVLLPTRKHRFPMHIEDQFMGYLERFNNFFKSISSFDFPLLSRISSPNVSLKSDLVFVKGKYFQEKLQSSLPSNKKTFISGSIQFEHLSHKDESEKKKIFSRFNLNLDKPLVILAPSTAQEAKFDSGFIFDSINRIQDSGKYNLLINPHYYDRVYYPNRFSDFSELLIPVGSFYDILPFSSCLVTPPSTIGLEASYVKVPLIIPNYYRESNLEFPYFRDGFCVGLKSSSKRILENIDKINRDFYKFNFEEFNRYMLNFSEDLPSSLIAKEIANL